MSTRATVVKTISGRILDFIADAQGFKILCGDIGNVFIQSKTNEKIFTRLGSEFWSRAGTIAIIYKALYGLTTSAERFRTLLADFIRSLGFTPSRYDRDVWLRSRDRGDGYDYICTHVDDFKIVARDAEMWMDKLKKAFLIKSNGPRDYYLGNDYKFYEMFNYGLMGHPRTLKTHWVKWSRFLVACQKYQPLSQSRILTLNSMNRPFLAWKIIGGSKCLWECCNGWWQLVDQTYHV